MKNNSPLKSIRKHCLDCSTNCGGVRYCTVNNCSLYPLGFGFNPYNKNAGRKLMDIIRKAKKETLRKYPDLEDEEKFYPEIDVSNHS